MKPRLDVIAIPCYRKQVILDKSVFEGCNQRSLGELAKRYDLLACDALLYECASSERREPRDLVNRYERLINAGAHYCSMSRYYNEWEAKHNCPYPQALADSDATRRIRCRQSALDEVLDSQTTNKAIHPRFEAARRLFVEMSGMIKRQVDAESPDMGKEAKTLPVDRRDRFRGWFEAIDKLCIHKMAVEAFPHWIKDKARFCLSPEWMTWHHIRIAAAVAEEYVYVRQMGGVPSDEGAEHDYQDMEYVLLLSRADTLLTRDAKLVALARAAFPEKDVYTSLDKLL